ncbi:rod shape-determining protein MreC [Teredinibacter turnerae]|uniref:rod shape-determining protein MreC n=1 Tax=Teredinibacter turnerae TaxID=2426 RepID=UPI0009B61B9B|nr:rod shape-determining protein MreC [Teredinibacter turnerae]
MFRQGPSLNVRVVLLTALSLAIAFTYLYTDWFDSLKKHGADISAPFYWVSDLPAKASDWADTRLMSRSRLEHENEALRTELLVLRRKVQLLASLSAENVRLRQLLNSTDMLQDRVIIAELIGVAPDPTVHKVIVNRGAEEGVYVGQAMVDANGLMGQVVTVGEHSSEVLLITDTTHALPVQINRNGVRLIAEGVGNLYELVIRHVSSTVDIQEGDLLVSSGLGQRFPVGYPVAKVEQVVIDPGKPFARVIARPMAEMNRSRHVLLVFDQPPADNTEQAAN